MNISIESKASSVSGDWKDGSFIVSFSGSGESFSVYNSSTTFTDITRQLNDGQVYSYSDVHFIEGNEYILDESSFKFEPITTDVTCTGVRAGSKANVSMYDIVNFGLVNDNVSFIYSSIEESVIKYLRFYCLVSGSSTYKNATINMYQLSPVIDYDCSYRVDFKYKGLMDNEQPVVPDTPETPVDENWKNLTPDDYSVYLFNSYSPFYKTEKTFFPSNVVRFDDMTEGTFDLNSNSVSGSYSGSGNYSGSGSYSGSGNYSGSGSYSGSGDVDYSGSVDGDFSGYQTNEGIYSGTGDALNEWGDQYDSGKIEIAGSQSGDIDLNVGGLDGDFDVSGNLSQSGNVSERGNVSESGSQYESGSLSLDLSGLGGTFESQTASHYFCTYDIDVPIEFEFALPDSTFDGTFSFPFNVEFDAKMADNSSFTFNSCDVVSCDVELYDSDGKRINAVLGNYGNGTYMIMMNFNNRLVGGISGSMRFHLTADFLYGGNNFNVGPQIVGRFSEGDEMATAMGAFALRYYEGDVSEKEYVTYQKSGHWETLPDGSIQWVEGETVTEYVESEESKKQSIELEEQTETQKGIFKKITEFFGSFFQNLIDTVIGLIVPSDDEMEALLDEFKTFFSDKFGFLFYPFELLSQALEIFKQDGVTALTFPAFSIMGYEVWPDLSYDIASNEIANTVFTYVRYATGAMLAMAFINYLRNFFDKRFGGGGN